MKKWRVEYWENTSYGPMFHEKEFDTREECDKWLIEAMNTPNLHHFRRTNV
jgi:hypothetical protein